MREINIKLQGKKVLITGAAGFIGANLTYCATSNKLYENL